MTASDLIAVARAELGATESPAGSNRVKYNTWYYGRPVSGAYPWCMAFVQWCLHQAGITPPVRTASCGAFMTAARRAGQWVESDFRPGDVLIYDFPGGAATDHCGICLESDGGSVTAIEGNTSLSNASNGGQVARMSRPLGQVRGAWRANFEEEKTVTYQDFQAHMDRYLQELAALPAADWGEEWQQARAWAEATGLIRGDGTGSAMYQSFATRQQLAVMLYRLMGKEDGHA